jgi:hypothetical protein
MLDGTTFPKHSTLHQCQTWPNAELIGKCGFGVVVGESDKLPTNEEIITFCAEERTCTLCYAFELKGHLFLNFFQVMAEFFLFFPLIDEIEFIGVYPFI